MRLPNEDQLSREQREVCFAPTDQSILVTGPPGSGKTIVAYFRSNSLKENEMETTFIAFTNVLTAYTEGMDRTFDSWICNWWNGISGGRWLPTLQNRVYDFEEASRLAREDYMGRVAPRGHWGHLLLDEAQDFSPDAHHFLNFIRRLICDHLGNPNGPQITIFADENQRLNETSSALKQIRDAHRFRKDDEYKLRRNYRNTKEIAAFAAEFYVGLSTGVPNSPDVRGNKPKIVLTEDIDDAAARIVKHANRNEDEEIGVLVFNKNTRNKLFNKLKHRLEPDGFRVQKYAKKPDAETLVFDEPKTITILCFASAKGLEFDSVFMPELQTFNTEGGREDEVMMTMYVMCSRARKSLSLMISDRERKNGIWAVIPEDGSLFEFEN
jgi:DNA helicase II / ATP-dependent DNA helicase PcrA